MRGLGSSTAGESRKVDGAIGENPTDSHDPRTHEQEGRTALLFVKTVFSSTGRGAFSFAVTKENGGRIPAGTLRPQDGVLTSAPSRRPP